MIEHVKNDVEELKSCPFCQEKVIVKYYLGPNIECNNCGYVLRQLTLGKDIIKAWNTRTEKQ